MSVTKKPGQGQEYVIRETEAEARARFLNCYLTLAGPDADRTWLEKHLDPLLVLAVPSYVPAKETGLETPVYLRAVVDSGLKTSKEFIRFHMKHVTNEELIAVY